MSLGYFYDEPDLPTKSYGELMDEIFSLWLTDGTGKTLEEFMAVV